MPGMPGGIVVGGGGGGGGGVDTDDQTAAEVPFADADGHTAETTVEGALTELYELVAAAGGGGLGTLEQAYVGRNSAGGSFESMTTSRMYAKKITIGEACLLTDVEGLVKGNGSNVGGFQACVCADNAGSPGKVLSYSVAFQDIHNMTVTAGWVGRPQGLWLTPGDYWIVVMTNDSTNTDATQIAYDAASGGDKIAGTGGAWFTDSLSWSSSDRNYSIRANTLTPDPGEAGAAAPATDFPTYLFMR